jgi:hypothetical protein
MMQRISAEMDREAAAMFQRVDALAARAQSGEPINVAFGNLPPGSSGYSYISTMSGNGVCTRSVEITATGNQTPRVVSHSSGNCGPAATSGGVNAVNMPGAVPATPAVVPSNRPDMVWTSAEGQHPYAGMVRNAAYAGR